MHNIEIDEDQFRFISVDKSKFLSFEKEHQSKISISSKINKTENIIFYCDDDITNEDMKIAVNWVIDNSFEIIEKSIFSFYDIYQECQSLVIECLIDEHPDDIVPDIKSEFDLLMLCDLRVITISEVSVQGVPSFNFHFEANWDEEHGANAEFVGLKLEYSS